MTTPVIIEAAINGATTTERNPRMPVAPAAIAADGRRAAASYLESWRLLLAERRDAIVYPTVGFGTTVEERYAHVLSSPPRAGSG